MWKNQKEKTVLQMNTFTGSFVPYPKSTTTRDTWKDVVRFVINLAYGVCNNVTSCWKCVCVCFFLFIFYFLVLVLELFWKTIIRIGNSFKLGHKIETTIAIVNTEYVLRKEGKDMEEGQLNSISFASLGSTYAKWLTKQILTMLNKWLMPYIDYKNAVQIYVLSI